MEEPQPFIQSERNAFGVHDANGFSGHVECTKRPSSSVSSRDDEYADVFRIFSGGMEAPSVPFFEFTSDSNADTEKNSGITYLDIFGGFGWELAVSLEELLGEPGTGDENKDLENDTGMKTRSSANSLPQIRGSNLREGVCNCPNRSQHVETISESQKNSGNGNSQPHEVFLSVAEINLQTQPTPRPPPSRPPPKLETRHSDSERNLGSSIKDCHENDIRKIDKRNHRNPETIASEIPVVERTSKASFIGIDKDSPVSVSDSMKEEIIEADGKAKIPKESRETGGDTPGSKLSSARNRKPCKQLRKCKTIHEFFELAETAAAVRNKQYQKAKDGKKPHQDPQEPAGPINLKRCQENYNCKKSYRTFHDDSKLEATRKARNASLGVLHIIETESLDISSAEKAFHQGVLSKSTSVHKTTAQVSKQVGKSSTVRKDVPDERDGAKLEVAEMFTASSREIQNRGDRSEPYDGTGKVNNLKQSYDWTRNINNMWHKLSFKKKNLQCDGSPPTSQPISDHPEFEFEIEELGEARSQRCQKSADQVAKALAEAKHRDFLVREEHAEGSRLAETLHGDIKSWSNGEEGNLRALLSTSFGRRAAGSLRY